MSKIKDDLKSIYGIEINQPLYVYQTPMFMLTVSTVLIIENGVALVREGKDYRFPSTRIKTGKETIPFAAVRNIKEEIGIVLPKDSLIPVDFRSSPDRSNEGNVVDIGFVCMPEKITADDCCGKWMEINFEKKNLVEERINLKMDHDILMGRAIEIALMFKN